MVLGALKSWCEEPHEMISPIDAIVALILIYIVHELLHLLMAMIVNDRFHGFLIGITSIVPVMGLVPDGRPSLYTQVFPAVLTPIVWLSFADAVRVVLTLYTLALILVDIISYNILPKFKAGATAKELDLYGILITSRCNDAIHMYKGNKITIGSLVIAYGKLS